MKIFNVKTYSRKGFLFISIGVYERNLQKNPEALQKALRSGKKVIEHFLAINILKGLSCDLLFYYLHEE